MWLLEPSVTVEQRCYAGILDLITGAVDDQRRAGHVAEFMNDTDQSLSVPIITNSLTPVLWPSPAQVRERRPPQRVRRSAARQNEVLKSLSPVRSDVLYGERDAPGLPEQVKVAPDAGGPDEVVQFDRKERRREKSHVWTRPSAEPVVQDAWPAVCLVHFGVREHVRVKDICLCCRLELRAGLKISKDRVRCMERL